MISFIPEVEKILKISIKNKSLFIQAFTHKSFNQESNNEKLEFLGDRVIGLILSKKLFDLYPNESEGVLDKRFAKLVNKKTCATIFWSLGLEKFVILGNSYLKLKKFDEKILSDTCEALIGAIYLDKGFSSTEKFVIKFWNEQISKSNVTLVDSKTKLQEYSLKKFKNLPIYNDVFAKGPKHNPFFKVSVKIKGSKKFMGVGSSKKDAQQKAAKNLLLSINIK